MAVEILIVADTTPLLHLARIAALELLPALFGEVVVPASVWRELVEARPDAPGVAGLRLASWLRVLPDAPVPAVLAAEIAAVDPGEAAAIALAWTAGARWLLMDDAAGRRVATRVGVSVRGTLGILVMAKEAGAIEAVAPLIEALLADGFRASETVIVMALRAAGEADAP